MSFYALMASKLLIWDQRNLESTMSPWRCGGRWTGVPASRERLPGIFYGDPTAMEALIYF